MDLFRRALILAAALACGCTVTLPEGRIACADQEPRCPEGWRCDEPTDRCFPPGVDPMDAGADEGTPDVLVDAPDAGPPPSDGGPDADASCTRAATPLTVEFAGAEDDEVNDIIAVSDGYVIVGSTSSASVRLGCASDDTGNTTQDAFVAKLDNNGFPLWFRRFGSSLGGERAFVVSEALGGELIVAGLFVQPMLFPGLDGDDIRVESRASIDVFVTKLNRDGGVMWATSYGGPGEDSVFQSAILDGNRVCLVGSFLSSLGSGAVSAPDPVMLTSVEADLEGYVLCMRLNDGVAVWGNAHGGPRTQVARGVSVVENTGGRRRSLLIATSAGKPTDNDATFWRFECTGVSIGCTGPAEIFTSVADNKQIGAQILQHGDNILLMAGFSGNLSIGDLEVETEGDGVYIASVATGTNVVNWAAVLSAPPGGDAVLTSQRMFLVDDEVHIVGDFSGAVTSLPEGLDLNYDGGGERTGFHAVLDGGSGDWVRSNTLGVAGRINSFASGPDGEILAGRATESVYGLMYGGGRIDGFVHGVR